MDETPTPEAAPFSLESLEVLQDLTVTGQTRLLVVVIFVYALFSLPAFWLCGAIILRKPNPFRAVFGFAGAWALAALLAAFYIYMGSRVPKAAIGLGIFGGIIVTWAIGTFVSVIYKTKTWPALKMFLSHFLVAGLLALITVLALVATDNTATLHEVLQWISESPEPPGKLT